MQSNLAARIDKTWHVMSRLVARCTVSRATRATLLASALCTGCVGEAADVGSSQERGRALTRDPEQRVAAIRAAGDARELTPELRAGAVDPDAAVRGAAIQVLGWLESEAVIPMLELALADGQQGIRLDAARGLARHPGQPAALREAQLLGAYAAAGDGIERAELIGLLADSAVNASSPAFGRALRGTLPGERAAGCLAIQQLAARGRTPAVGHLERVVELLGEDDSGQVLRACATVIAEPVARETLPAAARSRARAALEAIARRTDPEVASAGMVALVGIAGPDALAVLEQVAGSTEHGIARESVRVLRRIAPPAVLSALAERELDRIAPVTGAAMFWRSDVLLELIGALEQKPDQPEASDFAQRTLRRLGTMHPALPAHTRLQQGLLHCAAARLADAARHWPKELLACGHGAVPDHVREAWVAEAFARIADSDELRAVQLGRLFEKGQLPVRIAVLRATATLPVKHAATQLKLALKDADPRVLAAAAAAIGSRPALRDGEDGSRVEVADLLESAEHVVHTPEAAISWLLAARVLARTAQPKPITNAPGSTPGSSAHDRAAGTSGSEPIAIKALSAVPPALIERVTQLARHAARAVREPARALLSEWEAPVPAEIDPIAKPLSADRMPAAGTLFHVKLMTTAGPIELELDAKRTPVAAVRFVELARSGALDGLLVADRSPGHAVAFSPSPSPDRPALRHEDNSAQVERGSVLLQDHGRDAAGPGFALILARAPGLDRRAMQIGRITGGLTNADRLLPGDSILEAQVSIDRR